MSGNTSITKDVANREGQNEIAKAISNFGALKNALRSETASALSEKRANRAYYYACEAEIAADIATRKAAEAAQSAADAAASASEAEGYLNDIRSETGRMLKVPVGTTGFNTIVPIEAGKAFKVNDAGTGFESFTPGEGQTVIIQPAEPDPTPTPVEVDLSKALCLDEDTEENWDAQNKRIINSATPVEGTDVANKNYVDRIQVMAQSGGKILYIDSTSMLNEELSVEDGQVIKTDGYYAAGDGGGATYKCKWIPDAKAKKVPWVFKLGLSSEIEYQIQYRADGSPVTDAEGNYVYVLDENNHQIPVLENGQPKHKRIYAEIDETVVNYRMFGAKLDGIEDDEDAIRNTHDYQRMNYKIEKQSERKYYYISVENHSGIIKKSSAEPILCCGNIDLSGSQLIVQDSNATWFGFYLWGDNEIDYFTYEPTAESKDTYVKDNFIIGILGNEGDLKQNCLLFLKEDPYAVRDDAGHVYTEPRYELLLHTSEGFLGHPFTEDWNQAGGEEIFTPITNYTTHQLIKTETVISKFTISYTKLSATSYHFKGCEVILNTSANKYCSVLWCKCHNAYISDFTFYPDTSQLHNTSFKNTMIYVWGSYNVEVYNIVGFNASGKRLNGVNGTSGYVLRATNCLNLRFHDIAVQGYWGATAMNCVKDVYVRRVSINRLDIHNYFYNLYIDECNMYNHGVQIGEGRGICRITNTDFYVNYHADDSWPNAHILEFNLSYGRIFEGKVLIENCNAYLKRPEANELDVCHIEFAPQALSTLPHYKFPEVTIRDCHFYSYDANTYLVYFMISGIRSCTTSSKSPSNIVNYCRDVGNDGSGNLFWKYIGRGVDWFDNGDTSRLDVVVGQFVRTFEKYLDAEGKTVFHSFKYFQVTQAGTLPVPSDSNKPSNLTGNEFTCGTAKLKYTTKSRWFACTTYNVGDYCFTETSGWMPLFCYECITGGYSNGYRPIHNASYTSRMGEGVAIDGEDISPYEQDAIWWRYIGTFNSFITGGTFTPNMHVNNNDFIYADGRIYKVIGEGYLRDTPPVDTNWNGSFYEGTAQLSFRGKDWAPKTWWDSGCYCISEVNGVKYVYQVEGHHGTTSGDYPVPGNPYSVDGNIIWEYTTDAATKTWVAQTQFYEGDVVSSNGNNYKCVFDGRLELPYQINIENITTNMIAGDVFAFYNPGTDTDVATKLGNKSEWKIKISNVDVYRFRDQNCTYFCHAGNPEPTIIEGSGGGSGSPGAPGKSAYQYAVDAGYTGTENQFSIALNNALSLVDGDEVAY